MGEMRFGGGKVTASRLRTIGIAAGAVVVAAALLDPFHIVPSGYVGVPTHFGAVQPETLDPGIHFVMPVIAAIHDVTVQPHTATTDEAAATHDQQNVTTRAAVTWSIAPAFAAEVYRDFRGADGLASTIIAPVISNDVKAVIAEFEAQQLITDRSAVAREIAALISRDLARFHVQVAVGGVNIVEMRFSEAYDHAIEAKQIAQQQALQARYTLEQTQTSSQAQVVQARAAADAAVATAAGSAKATVLQAEADAQAYRDKQVALTPALLQLTALNKWNGVLPTYMGGQTPIPFLEAPAK